jgi:2-amino-4-hydroxy-6-hydroxymethyldihydropteridine diphosphokinase
MPPDQVSPSVDLKKRKPWKPASIFTFALIMAKHKTHLLLGGNLGDRHANLAAARKLIGENIGTIVKMSSLYETEPWGKADQPAFLNQALEVATDLNAATLLERILSIEKKLGRLREDKWSARTIDIDILFFDAKILNTKDLTLPHPHLHERNFVLVPMLEIAPNKQHPIFKKTIEELYEASKDDLEVTLLDEEAA